MSYIGKTPTVGNFQVCDAISVVNNQAAYTMKVATVNVSPESANHMIVSLNGVIQKPTDAFTVSGSTITFASNLVTGDVINFIQILGNVLDLGVPSDSTVSIAKLTATGTKNSTTFLRGDNTFATAGLTGVTTDSGNVTITDGNLTFGGAGHGVHLGVTSATAANLLDDYEEGTYTPAISFGGGTTSIAYNSGATAGVYTKIGRMVTVSVNLVLTNKGSSTGTAEITLPFTPLSFHMPHNHGQWGMASRLANVSAMVGMVFRVRADATTAYFQPMISGTSPNNSFGDNSHFTNTTNFAATFVYATN